MRPEDRERIVSEVITRVHASENARGEAHVEETLLEAAWYEMGRLSSERPSSSRDDGLLFWKHAQAEMLRASPDAQRDLLRQVISQHASEIVGNFNPSVYKMTTRVVPPALGLLLNTQHPSRLLGTLPHMHDLAQTMVLQGRVEAFRRLVQRGTVVLVPTHFSHLDSIAVGWAINELKLPPFTYGAGLNLFTNPLLSYFMQNLGAYKVDRKKKHELYKEVLKTYCTVSLEMGYNNLFFPGGTRSRSGAVESRLKLGLLGCGLGAWINNLRAGKPRPKVFIVPATLSYQLVLEAETLIEDFLQEQGKSRFIIEDDEFSEPRRILQFVLNLVKLDSRIYITIGQALDPFGNPVDEDGNSHDGHGRPIDIARYVQLRGEPRPEPDRDHEYTRQLGSAVTRELHRCNVLQSTHVVARVLWRMLKKANGSMEHYKFLRTGGRVRSLRSHDVILQLEALLGEVMDRSGRGELLLDPGLVPGKAREVLEDGMRHFATYHSEPVVTRRGEEIVPGPLSLLYYYQNRLDGYGL